METAPSTFVSLLLVLFILSSPAAVPAAMARPVVDVLTPDVLLVSPPATPSALAPGPDVHASDYDVYIVFVSRTGYIDSVDYDVRLLASVIGSTQEAKKAMIYHYSGLGFAARLTCNQADQLARKEGIATFKDKTYYVDNGGRLPRFFEENV
ncbi:uncharacterized protein LOC119281487 [Triticum dicoccoides]|uniref:Inhibitor I9 domain-containing protein n=2 Tax=Triticum TaxID=4564 RepID=W5CXX1_WHEAT|nr:uncharacterized protein LOC119281487 [Triticum dicoccoides]XP_044344817.1 uncharacterized protein LOC123065638 [Triticum aestivum]CDM84080.1 unnamed protein product [Triticum aestivum]VAH79478.1 unnamed protein product [Triticum turgidum subsp. durum]